MDNPRDTIDITPQQYHAGLDKLWEALGLHDPQDEDVFTLAARAITTLKKVDDVDLLEALEAMVNAVKLGIPVILTVAERFAEATIAKAKGRT